MRKAAAHFLASMELGERSVRLDVIAFEADGAMTHLKNVDAL
jgi:Holliday junction resolvase-like predicted endonuclease